MRRYCDICGAELAGRQASYCSDRCRNAATRDAIRAEFIEEYGGHCQCPGGCSVSEPTFLSLGHLGGRGIGNQHRRLTRVRGWQMLLKIRAEGWPKDRYRLECYNCNMSRAHDPENLCAHQRRPKPRTDCG